MPYMVKVILPEGEPIEHPYEGCAKALYKYGHMVQQQAHHCALVNSECCIELIDLQQGITVKQTFIKTYANRNYNMDTGNEGTTGQ